MGRLTDIRTQVAELLDASRDEEPEPEGYSQDARGGYVMEGSLLEHKPDADIEDYREVYENLGIVNTAIDNYASEVIEPGWWITADSSDTEEKISDYFKKVGMLNNKQDVHASKLIETIVKEREISGTVFLEKVTDSKGRNQALYPLQAQTMSIYTKPGKNILPHPTEDDEAVPYDPKYGGDVRTPVTDDGKTASYVQFDDINPRWSGNSEVKFTRDEVIKWTRDAGVGDAYGNSRIKNILGRAESLLKKLDDNDSAIESKAYPQIIFQLGSEERPYSMEEAQNFIDNYDDENLEPGTMVAVSGDIDVKEFAGETADISDDLEFDINMIMSGLPGAVYSLGGFSQDVPKSVAEAQKRQATKEVKKTRRELENIFTPYLQEVAKDYNLDDPESVELHMGRPDGEVAPEDMEGNIIQYQSTVNKDSENNNSNSNSGSSNNTPSNQSSSSDVSENSSIIKSDIDNIPDESVDVDIEELADPRLVSTQDRVSSISGVISNLLLEARDSILTEFRSEYEDSPITSVDRVEGLAMRSIHDVVDSEDKIQIEEEVLSVIQNTLDTLSQQNHNPQISSEISVRHRRKSDSYTSSVIDEVRKAINDIVDSFTTQVSNGIQSGENAELIADRVENKFDDSYLENRADVIARMEVQSIVNGIKLSEYDSHPNIDGYKIINPCNESTTRLCEDLSGCEYGESAVVWFDSDENASSKLMENTSESKLYDGFNPIPSIPPFHYNCRSEIVPAKR